MKDRNFAQELKDYVYTHPKLVKARPVDKGLYILKYTNHVFFKGLWNEYLEECRGTVVDKDFNVVTRPFTKIYNYGIDKDAPVFHEDTPVTAIRKVNGFLVNVSFYQNDLIITTTGAAQGPHVDMAKEYISQIKNYVFNVFEDTLLENCTLMFECVHPEDPHIISEKSGLYLIGIRENKWDSDVIHDKYLIDVVAYLLSVKTPNFYEGVTIKSLKECTYHADHEGYVFYTEDGQAAKMKSPYYLNKKLLARITSTEKLLDRHTAYRIDEEYYPLLKYIRSMADDFIAMTEQERIKVINDFFYFEMEPPVKPQVDPAEE